MWIPMADGVRLSARLFLPETPGPWPALLEALPYRKDDLTASYSDEYRRLRDEGDFAVARLDLRGTGASEGIATDEYPPEEQTDIAAVIAWLADSTWCNGKVGMFGTSYSGFNSLQVAAERPPALAAVIAIYASDDRYTDDVHYVGGTLRAVDLIDYVIYMAAMNALPPTPELTGPEWRAAWGERFDASEPWLLRWLEEQWDGPYWRHGSLRQRGRDGGWEGYERIEAATMIVGGWADGYRNNTLRTYAALHAHRRLLVGPWAHLAPGTAVPGPQLDLVPEMIAWFDRWLRDREEAEPVAPIRIYTRRPTHPEPDLANYRGGWRSEPAWPPAGASELVLTRPEDQRAPEVLAVRGDVGTTAWISCAGHLPWGQPTDQRPDEGLSLVYDWPAPSEDLEILGHPRVEVTVTSDVPVASLAAKLCSVFPDGTSALVTRGFLNLCHRHSSLEPEPLIPGEPITISLELEATSWIFEPGHAIRLDLAGADWPNSWPSPTPCTLTVDPASLRLVLPVMGDVTPEEPLSPERPAPDDGGADSSTTDPVTWRIEHDVLGRATRAVIDHGTAYDGEFGSRVEEHYDGAVSVSTVDPGIAHATARARYRIAWPDTTVTAEARLKLTSDRDAFTVAVELDAERGHRSRRRAVPQPELAPGHPAPAPIGAPFTHDPSAARLRMRRPRTPRSSPPDRPRDRPRCEDRGPERAPGPRSDSARGCRAPRPDRRQPAGSVDESDTPRGCASGRAARPAGSAAPCAWSRAPR